MYPAPVFPQRPEKDIRCSRTEVIDICELQCGCWESNLDPLEERHFLITTSSISLAPTITTFIATLVPFPLNKNNFVVLTL